MPKVSYVQVEPQNYKLMWAEVNDVRKILPKNQSENAIEDEVVTTKGKNYVGVIISQQIGKKITIKTSTSTVEIPATDIKETIKLPVPRTTSLYKLADYVNTLVLMMVAQKKVLSSLSITAKKIKSNMSYCKKKTEQVSKS